MTDNMAGRYGCYGTCQNNWFFFENILMIIIIFWLLRWLFGFDNGAFGAY